MPRTPDKIGVGCRESRTSRNPPQSLPALDFQTKHNDNRTSRKDAKLKTIYL